MNDKTRRRVGSVALTLGLGVICVLLLLTAVHRVGTDDALYFREQMRANILPEAGISEGDLRLLDGRLAACLKGDETALDVAVRVFGVTQPAFNGTERAHMADCLYLFNLLRGARRRLIPWAIVLTLGGAWLLRDRRRARLCAWLSPLIVLLPVGLFALYAALDFDRAFTLFHRALFRNDLWLLDPATDLLIRICPESMFMHMGILIGVFSLTSILAVSAIAAGITFLWPRGREENSWKTTTRRGPAPKQITFGNRDMR